jgi:hypothetical protein
VLANCCVDGARNVAKLHVPVRVKVPSEAATNVQQPHVMAQLCANVKHIACSGNGSAVGAQVLAAGAHVEGHAGHSQVERCCCCQQLACILWVGAILEAQGAACLQGQTWWGGGRHE